MSDRQTIAVTDVSTSLRLGVPEEERREPQTVLISAVFQLDDPPPFDARSTISDTIDYAVLIAFIRDALPATGAFVLVETVADTVAAFVLAQSARIVSVDITVKKPSVLGDQGLVAVTIRRHRETVRRRRAAIREQKG